MANRKKFLEALEENLRGAMALSEYWLSQSNRELKNFKVAVSFCGACYVSMDGGEWWRDFTPPDNGSWKIFEFKTQEEALANIEKMAN